MELFFLDWTVPRKVGTELYPADLLYNKIQIKTNIPSVYNSLYVIRVELYEKNIPSPSFSYIQFHFQSGKLAIGHCGEILADLTKLTDNVNKIWDLEKLRRKFTLRCDGIEVATFTFTSTGCFQHFALKNPLFISVSVHDTATYGFKVVPLPVPYSGKYKPKPQFGMLCRFWFG